MMGMSIEHVPDERRTTAMGLFQAVYGVGMFAGPSLSGVLADAIGIRPMFGATALACLVAGLAVTYWLTASRQQPTSIY
jgi:DHA1 family multidrug resistance protein-like MFS transporter